MNLSVSYMGLKLKSPIIAGSCGLTNTIENLKKIEENGAGAVVIKSMFEEQINYETDKYIKGANDNIQTFTNAPDSIFSKRIYDYAETYEYIYDYAKTHALDQYLQFLKDAKKAISIPVIASINCVSNYDWAHFAKRIEDAGVDGLEINMFILPSDFRRTSQDNEQIYYSILSEIRKFSKLPVALKIGYYFSSLANSVIQLSSSGAQALVLFNRPYNIDIDIENLTLSGSKVTSSDHEYHHTLRWMAILSGKTSCDLAATTGVHNAETVIKYLLAGANTVHVASILYNDGFEAITKLNKGLEDWMKKHNFDTIDQFRGKLNMENIPNPAAFERVQFMKLYSKIE